MSHDQTTARRFVEFDDGPVTVARRLLGQRLVRRIGDVRLAGIIVEVEAYLGPSDRAAHSFGGRRTPRNEAMYLAGGHSYVYFIYGMHFCMNVVCGVEDEPVAVLLRGVQPIEGLERMRRNRPKARRDLDLCSGPARLTQAFEIDRSLDGADLRTSDALWIERARGRSLAASRIAVSPRVGVGYAGSWASRPLRFSIVGNDHVSRPRPDGHA